MPPAPKGEFGCVALLYFLSIIQQKKVSKSGSPKDGKSDSLKKRFRQLSIVTWQFSSLLSTINNELSTINYFFTVVSATAFTTAPSRKVCTPCTTIFSPACNPSFTIILAPTARPKTSLRCDTLLLSPNTYAK